MGDRLPTSEDTVASKHRNKERERGSSIIKVVETIFRSLGKGDQTLWSELDVAIFGEGDKVGRTVRESGTGLTADLYVIIVNIVKPKRPANAPECPQRGRQRQ